MAVRMRDPDVVVIGAGPNGLVAACMMAKAGMKVLVLEAHPTRPGGALATEESTLPGFHHDVGAAFFPFANKSPAFVELDLLGNGLEVRNSKFESVHPSVDGTFAALSRDLEVTAQHFGSPKDGAKWAKVARWYTRIEDRLLPGMLHSFPAVGPLLRLGPLHPLRLAAMFTTTGKGLGRRLFETDAAARVIPALGLHTDVGPDDTFGSGIGLMLALTAMTGGFAVPVGGAGAITATLITILEAHGGAVEVDSRVEEIVLDGKKAVAVKTAKGEEIRVGQAVMADTAAATLYLSLLDQGALPGFALSKMKRFPQGWGTFKMDWALNAPVPWTCEAAREGAVVHTGDSLDDLSRFTNQVRGGSLPDNPYLVIGQQSLADPSRAPEGKHTLWAYSRVPNTIEGGWAKHAEALGDVIDARIEALAPGFRETVLERRVVSPRGLEEMDENLVGGDLGGGSNAWNRQLIFRPLFPWFRNRTPIKRLYLCSSYTHPGAGVHGMCGYNAARSALNDLT